MHRTLLEIALISCPIIAATRAYAEPPDTEPFVHPLLTDHGREVVNEVADRLGTRDPEVLLRHLVVGGATIEDDQGWRVVHSVKEIVEVEGAHTYPQSLEPAPSGASVSALLAGALAEAAPTERVAAEVCLRRVDWKPVVSAWHEVDLAILRGEVSDWGDVRHVIQGARTRMAEAGRAAVDAFVTRYAGRDLAVDHVTAAAGCVDLSAPASVLQDLLRDAALTSADVVDPPQVEDAGYLMTVTGPSVNGLELEDLIQSTQFYDQGYSGDERIGILDGNSNGIFRRHQGFDDANGAGRLENCGNPDSNGDCTSNPDPTSGYNHGTASASIVLGDITAGQDPNITGDTDQRERSGVAREATGLAISIGDNWQEAVLAPEDISLTMRPGGEDADNLCLGNYTTSVKINTLFESGVFGAWSAGNTGHGSGNCRVRPGQTAIGAFVVGAYHINSNGDEVIYDESARGGGGCLSCNGDTNAYNDDTRTIVSVTAPSLLEHPYPHYDTTTCPTPFDYRSDWGDNCIDNAFCCTSSAVSVVGGAAAIFREWWLAEIGSAIQQPERMFTEMLLMGDRQGESGMLTSGFDELRGAGKLRLRLFDADGMDSPALHTWGNVCIDHNADVVFEAPDTSTSQVPADVDMIRIVAWWYDGRHDSGTEHDKIDLKVEWDDNGTWTFAGSSTTDDNRQRVYISQPHNARYRATFTGRDVTTDVQGCGTDSMMVWYSSFMEDSDRDDGGVITGDEPHVRPE